MTGSERSPPDHRPHTADHVGELLAILAEECAEAAQAAMKAQRHGLDSWNPRDGLRTPNRRDLERELGDILAVVELLTIAGELDETRIRVHMTSKRTRHMEGETLLHHRETLGLAVKARREALP